MVVVVGEEREGGVCESITGFPTYTVKSLV